MTAPSTADEVLDAHEAAALLGMHYRTVLRHIRTGELRAVKRRKRIYIRRQWIDEFLDPERGEVAAS